MQRYFFDFHDGGDFPIDAESIELDGVSAAKQEAHQALVQAMFFESNGEGRTITCRVRDSGGNIIYCADLTLRGAVGGAGIETVQ